LPKKALPFEKRQVAKITPVEPHEIERREARRLLAKEKRRELGVALRVEHHKLAVKDAAPGLHALRQYVDTQTNRPNKANSARNRTRESA